MMNGRIHVKTFTLIRFASLFLSLIICANGFQIHTSTIPSTRAIGSSIQSKASLPMRWSSCIEKFHTCSSRNTFTPLCSQSPRQSTVEEIRKSIEGESSSSITTSNSEIMSSTTRSQSELEDEIPFSDFSTILILCWLVAMLAALDRVAMSVAIIPLSTEFHLTDTDKGSISSIFSLGYGLGILPAGLMVSSFSPRLIMASGVALWSVATFGTPLAANLIHLVQNVETMSDSEITTSIVYMAENIAPLLLMRSIMGAAESVVLPTIQRMLANWVPQSKKTFSVAAVLSGFQIGTVLAYLVSPWVMEHVGWRGLFYVYGGMGALWLVPWYLLAKDYPERKLSIETSVATPNVNVFNSNGDARVLVNELKEDDDFFIVDQRLVGIESLDATESEMTPWEEATGVIRDAPWKDLLTSKATWAMTLAHAANNWGLYNMLSWNPTFYAEQYGLNIKESAFLSVLPSVAGAVSAVGAGFAADKILSNFATDGDIDKTTFVRKGFQTLALLGPAACLFTMASHIPDDPATAQILLTGTVGLQAFSSAGYSAANQEKAGEKWTGLLYSITSLPGVVFGSMGVYITGQILDLTDKNWSAVYGLTGAVDVIGGLAFLTLYNSKKEFD